MNTVYYEATLYDSNEGQHDTEDVRGILHSDRTITEEDVRTYLIRKHGCDDAHDINIDNSDTI